MKRIIMLFMLAIPIVSTASTNGCHKLVQQLAGLTEVGGSAVGAHATPGRFYTLSLDFLSQGAEPDFQQLLGSTNPVVRLMGVYCLVNTRTNMSEVRLPASVFVDTNKVFYASGGCFVMRKTVSEIAQEFVRDPKCLDPLQRKQ